MWSSARAQFGCTLIVACTLTLPLWAQWERYPSRNVPRTADGKVDLDAAPRRAADGKVDLSGVWEPASVRHLLNIAADLKPQDVPLQPWAAELLQTRIETNGRDHPGALCLPSGIPEKLSVPDGVKLVQTPDAMIFMWDSRKTKQVDNWAMEMNSPNSLIRLGWSRRSMSVGDTVVVEGGLARDGTRTGNIRSVTLASTGTRLFGGSGQEGP